MASNRGNTALEESPDDIAKDKEIVHLLAKIWFQQIISAKEEN